MTNKMFYYFSCFQATDNSFSGWRCFVVGFEVTFISRDVGQTLIE